MFKAKMTIFTVLLMLTALILTACGSAAEVVAPEPEADVPEPEAEIGLDGDWMPDDTPPYPHAQFMRDRLDPALDQAFGIEAVHYHTFGPGETYNVRYALQNVQEGEAFYLALGEIFEEVFDFQVWDDWETAESYFATHDELPDVIGVMLNYEDSAYFWDVGFDGTYLIFAPF